MHLLITAGGTREYIDPVRFISNASSGRMGIALARAGLRAGHEVTLILAPAVLRPPRAATVVPVVSAAEMFAAVKSHFEGCDALVMAAAVSDYTPIRPGRTKRKKQPGPWTLTLKPTPDILAWAGRHKRGRVVVGFALEDRDVLSRAEAKRRAKHADLIVANTPQAIGATESEAWIRSGEPDSRWLPVRGSKDRLARAILRQVERLATTV